MGSYLSRQGIVQRIVWGGGCGIVLVAALVGHQVQLSWNERAAAHGEMAGLQPAADLLSLVKATQEHRGLSTALLSGNEGLAARRQAKQAEIDKALAPTLAGLSAWSTARMGAGRDVLAQGWPGLSRAVSERGLKPSESFARHTALVDRELALLDELVAASGLALDPEPASYFLIVSSLQQQPQASEMLGRLRARGTALLGQPSVKPEDRVAVVQLLEAAQRAFDVSSANLERARAADPATLAPLDAAVADARGAFERAVAAVRRNLVDGEPPTLAAAAYFDLMTESIDHQYALSNASFVILRDVLTQRSARSDRAMMLPLLLGAIVIAGLCLFIAMTRSIRRNAAAAVGTAEALARGDFSVPAIAMGHDEFGRITAALERARRGMGQAVADVRHSVESLHTASAEIAQGNVDLSRRTEIQASALQQTAASAEQLASAVSHSAASARQACGLAGDAQAAASEGGLLVSRVAATMEEILVSSRRIGDIVGVIDGIAFQTNILALNAAVEAARAGEQGRGFAVVAAEVRTLAQRSAVAAREIKAMITTSSTSVEAGSRLANEAGQAMVGIVGQVGRVTALITEVTSGAEQQSSGFGQVNEAIAQMDHATQQNAALVEQSAAAAESLRQQADRLAQAVGVFTLAPA
jgi:methyl-accepting chemotaxis protein